MQEIIFEKIKDVSNPYSMHGIYPYRGKISAIDAANIIGQLPNTGTLLDPFCGSGTIVYEAQKHGLNAIGVDNNPLAVTLARAKVYKEENDKEASNRKQEIDRQHYTIPNQRPKDKHCGKI